MAALTCINASQHSTKRAFIDTTSLTSPPRKRPRPANTISPSKDTDKSVARPYAVPVLEAADDGSFSWRKFLHDYSAHKVVLLRCFQDTHGFGLRDVSDIFKRSASAKKTWCTENKLRGRVETNRLDPSNQRAGDSWYASFILQEDQKLLGKVVHSLPLSELTQQHSRFAKSTNETKSTWVHTSSVWFFVGSNTNPDATPMKGREEHTDAISHDGTWHLQVSGNKVWHLRMTEELKRSVGIASKQIVRCDVVCNPGDVIFINTRLWWHQTSIPVTTAARDQVSMSYARDVFCSVVESVDAPKEMCNVDGLYASAPIEMHTIIFTENAMPDCELPRSATPNCGVVTLEDGTGAVVSLRSIAEGEFFSVGFSDEEDSSDFDKCDEVKDSATDSHATMCE